MPPGTLFQLLGPWYANTRCPYVLVLVVAMLRMFGSNDDLTVVLLVYTQLKVLSSEKTELDIYSITSIQNINSQQRP